MIKNLFSTKSKLQQFNGDNKFEYILSFKPIVLDDFMAINSESKACL